MNVVRIGFAALLLGSALPAQAAPVDLDPTEGQVILVYGGCGVFSHRGPYGGCRPGGQAGGYIPGASCPPGWHIGRFGHRCWRN